MTIIRERETAAADRAPELVQRASTGQGDSVWETSIRQAKAKIANAIIEVIDTKWGTAVAVERAIGLSQTEISRIRHGKLQRYTLDRLFKLLVLIEPSLDATLAIEIRARRDRVGKSSKRSLGD